MADVHYWVAVEAATFEHGGETYSITPGVTTFADGHPVLAAHRDLFKPFVPSYPWEAPANTSRADQRGARTR